MPPSVSLCMIVKDEGERLTTCLRAAAPAAQEIVVVDTGSTDDTVAIAERFGAKVSTFDFRRPDFAAARNQSLAYASGDFALVLDADEILGRDAPAIVSALVEAKQPVGWVVARRNLRPPGMHEVLTDYAVRLFPIHPRHRYRGRVHETIDAALLAAGARIRTSRLTIDHVLPADDGRLAEKSRFYLAILDEELAAAPDDVDRLSFRRAELHKLGRLDEATRTAEHIAELAPQDAANHRHVGLYRLVHRRDEKGAREAFRRALDLEPDDTWTRDCLRSLEGPAASLG